MKSIAVIGPNADDDLQQLGDWSLGASQHPPEAGKHPREKTTTMLDGIRALAPEGLEFQYERGCSIIDDDLSGIPAAVAAAQAADVVVAVVGDHLNLSARRLSTATLELQGGQIALLDALEQTGKPMIVVLVNSKPLVLPPSAKRAAAIVELFNPGMEGGRALAEALFGLLNPSGKLTISIPVHVGQQPVFYSQVRGQHGNRYADLTQEPLFPFRAWPQLYPVRLFQPAAVLPQPGPRGNGESLRGCGERWAARRRGDRAGLRQRRGDLGHLGQQGAEGLCPRPVGAGREKDRAGRAALAGLPDCECAGH